MRSCLAVQSYLKLYTENVRHFKTEIGSRKVAEFLRFREREIAERVEVEKKLLSEVEQPPSREEDKLSFEEVSEFVL